MADMQTALRAKLVTATAAGTRIYWNIVSQSAALPYIRLQTISDPRPQHLDGYDSARETRVQCDCFAATYGAARAMAEAVIAATDGPFTQSGIVFGRVKAEGPRDLGEDTAAGYVHRASVDLLVWHREA